MKQLILFIALLTAGKLFAGDKIQFTAAGYVSTLKKVTDVMVNDVASPVAAGRYYAYITLCAYETQSLFNNVQHPSFAGVLKQFNKPVINPALITGCDYPLAVMLAILKTGEKLLPSGYLLKKDIDTISNFYKGGAAQQKYTATVKLVDEVVLQIIAYAKADGFTKLTNLTRYTPKKIAGYWQPTGPSFMAPVEPHWNTLRTFMLDSAQQFKPAPPAMFDTAVTSSFYKQLKEVYDVCSKADKNKKAIAMFWDCNPFAVQQIGHVEFGLKKISPGGHWIGITGIACNKIKMSLQKTVTAHVLVSITMADAFVACWDEKYRSQRIRPETAIQQLINPRWVPLLQTPPFPEYVSGHSVVSAAAAAILTKIFGSSFAYNDNTETEFGLPIRKYNSFKQAAEEAALSRLYGGIHFKDAIDEGLVLGKKTGAYIIYKSENYFKALQSKL